MLAPLVSLQQGNVKKSGKCVKVIDTEVENINIFWTTWGISISGKISLIIKLKVTKNQDFTLYLENTFFENLRPWGNGRGGGVESKLTPLLQPF